ncbi:RHS repeat-associated core domain-containing protein, partial [Reichenbachiella agariperforans]
ERISQVEGQPLSWTGLTAAGVYTVHGYIPDIIVTEEPCASEMIGSATIEISALPEVIIPQRVETFPNQTLDLPIANLSGGQWSVEGDLVFGQTIFTSDLGIGLHILTYSYREEGSVCPEVEGDLIVSVIPVPELNIDKFISDCKDITLGVLSTSSGYDSYTWFRDDVEVSELEQASVDVGEPGTYKVLIENNLGHSIFTNEVEMKSFIGSVDFNYVHSIKYKDAYEEEIDLPSTKENITSSITYYDGLGEERQVVMIGNSHSGFDAITPYALDGFGRTSKGFKSYVRNGFDEGCYDPNALSLNQNSGAVFDYYAGSPNTPVDAIPYSETIYEPSPLNRVAAQYGPGEVWRRDGRPVLFEYSTNIEEEVVWWGIVSSSLTNQGYYESASLYKNTTIDEEQHRVIEYKNLEGQVVLKKVQADESASEWAETYYVYDDFGNLRFVLPPKYSANLNIADFDSLAFQYHYDHRQRMTEKRVPGAGWVYMVYDDRDRLVLTQDANQRANKEWLFTKYDALNRPVITGIYTHGSEVDQATMQGLIDQFYEDAESNTDEWYEVQDNNGTFGYTNQSFPKTGLDHLSVIFYDNYGFTSIADWEIDEVDTSSEPTAKTYVTGTMTKVLGIDSSQDCPEGEGCLHADQAWNQSLILYDSRYRVDEVVNKDYQGNTDQVETDYYSIVYPLVVETRHAHYHADSDQTTTITEHFDYDHADRLMSVTHQINEETPVVILTNEYNELGELITKKLHQENPPSEEGAEGVYKQEIDYAYNIRGWLTHINDPGTDDPSRYFSMQLKYTDATHAQYNGNIGEIDWTNPMETAILNSYDYAYDPMNRLNEAMYSSTKAGLDYDVTGIDYDLNGNILHLNRLGDKDNGSAGNLPGQSIDELVYGYQGNQLIKVTDDSESDTGFKDGADQDEEYRYDANGNMTVDQNKGITEITYNHLNLPVRVVKSPLEGGQGGVEIVYIYDAAGVKQAQIVYEDGEEAKRTDYKGAFIYETLAELGLSAGAETSLQFIQHAEGRVTYSPLEGGQGGVYEYQYHLKDHLGNVRATFTSEPKTEQALATIEEATNDNFGDYDKAMRIKADLFNHTTGGEYAVRLNGSDDEVIGLSRQLRVKPGDVINLEVYAKYLDGDQSGGWTSALNTLVGQIAAASTGVVFEGANYGSAQLPFADLLTGKSDPSTAPKAYLNYLVFDNNYQPILEQSGYQQMSEDAAEDGTDVAHEHLSHSIAIEEAGYVYIYLSNENGTTDPIDVFFDDFRVEQQYSPIVQKDDYYPFGLSFNSYSNVGMTSQLFKYNAGSEYDVNLGFYMTQNRMMNPELGRFWGVDALADLFPSMSPMSYAYSNPIKFNDPLGLNPEGDGVGPQILDEVVVTAEKLPEDYSDLIQSINPLERAGGIALSKGDIRQVQMYSDQSNNFSYGDYLKEKYRPNKMGDAWMKIAAYSIGGTMVAIYGSPMLLNLLGEGSVSLSASSIKMALFGTTDLTSKAYLTKAGFNMFVETTNQLLTGDASQLDVFDIGAQGFLGLNTPISAGAGAVFDIKPFASDYNFVNLNSGSAVDFVTGYAAGKVGGLEVIKGSVAKPLIQWGADLSMKVISEGSKKAIEE